MKTFVEEAEHKPFAWATEPLPGESRELEGKNSYRFTVAFDSAGEFSKAKTQYKRELFALNDLAHQYLLASGRTIFKGMAFKDLQRMQVDIETFTGADGAMSDAGKDPLLAIALSDSSGWEEILVVEEKRAIIETQLKDQLFNWPAAGRPRIVGKSDEQGRRLLSGADELSPAEIAVAIASRVARFHDDAEIAARARRLEGVTERAVPTGAAAQFRRTPFFCSGCPHNTSTRVPDGSRALAGIGCHYMASFNDPSTDLNTHMGGEGLTWVGAAPFTTEKHVFQNLGDGTYNHSGSLAIRGAIARKPKGHDFDYSRQKVEGQVSRHMSHTGG